MKNRNLFLVLVLAVAAIFLFRKKAGTVAAGVNGSGAAPGGGGSGGGTAGGTVARILGGGANSGGVASGGGGGGSGVAATVNLNGLLSTVAGWFGGGSSSGSYQPRFDTSPITVSPLSLADFTPNPVADFGNFGLGYDSFDSFLSTPNFNSGTYFQDYADLGYVGGENSGSSSVSSLSNLSTYNPPANLFDDSRYGNFDFDSSGGGSNFYW